MQVHGRSSKGLFFRTDALPADPVEHDRLPLRAIGSPHPYSKWIDGMSDVPLDTLISTRSE